MYNDCLSLWWPIGASREQCLGEIQETSPFLMDHLRPIPCANLNITTIQRLDKERRDLSIKIDLREQRLRF
jgi:hypothetical protein